LGPTGFRVEACQLGHVELGAAIRVRIRLLQP
jgi:hypothetical protein